MAAPKKVRERKVKVKAWAILLQYEDDPPYIYQISLDRADPQHWYKTHQLRKKYYSIIPVAITYSLPKIIRTKKKHASI